MRNMGTSVQWWTSGPGVAGYGMFSVLIFPCSHYLPAFGNGWIWSQELSGKGGCWGLNWASLFFIFYSGWKRLSSFLDSNMFASKWAVSCSFPLSPLTKKSVAKPHWNVHLALESLFLQPFTLKDTSYGPFERLMAHFICQMKSFQRVKMLLHHRSRNPSERKKAWASYKKEEIKF